MSDYINELNESQRAAVLYNDGPSLVIAGAGSGKTRVLTYKIAYLLDNGYEPWSILALTFTNKAAREMKERISTHVGANRARYLWMGTFHSIFLRILHTENEAIGFTRQFTVYDAADSKSLIKSIIKEMNLDDKIYKPSNVQNEISNAKNRLITPRQYADNIEMRHADDNNRMPLIWQIYREYCDRCRRADAMDFDDLLLYTYTLFDKRKDILAKYQEQFRYVLVDEYQDTNYAQHKIVLQLAGKNQHVCVVGDDAQSIYSFRGAEIDNILNFGKMFQGTKLFKLEQNYRSTQTIVGAANSLIEKNRSQIRKEVYSHNDKGEPICLIRTVSDLEEGEVIANRISAMHTRQDLPFSDFAILYRTNAQSRIFEETMRKHSIPYRIYGGLSFYQRKEIKDIIAYFRMAVNPNDEEAFKRTINYPARGIGNTTVDKIIATASQNRVSLWEVIMNATAYGLNVNRGTMAKLQGFGSLIQGFHDQLAAKTAYALGKDIILQSGIVRDVMQDSSAEGLSRKENIDEMENAIQSFVQERLEQGNTAVLLADYLSDVSLLTDQDNESDTDTPKVTIMTMHAAKGLEFGTVFVAGVEEGLLPSIREDINGRINQREIEEERRLFYVAITRAKERCFLSCAKMRFRYGKSEFTSPSRFLSDIDRTFMDIKDYSSGSGTGSYSRTSYYGDEPWQKPRQSSWQPSARMQQPTQSTAASTPPSRPSIAPRSLKRVGSTLLSPSSGAPVPQLSAGQTIEHERFGRGTVLSVDGCGDEARATIKFNSFGNDKNGTKTLLLRFAKFKIVQ